MFDKKRITNDIGTANGTNVKFQNFNLVSRRCSSHIVLPGTLEHPPEYLLLRRECFLTSRGLEIPAQTMVNYITMKPLVRMMMMLLGIRVMMTMIIMMKRHKLG